MELVGEALSEAHKLKKPDLPAGGSPYELLARDVIRTLYEYGVIVKQPVVKPLTKSRFELSFRDPADRANPDQRRQQGNEGTLCPQSLRSL